LVLLLQFVGTKRTKLAFANWEKRYLLGAVSDTNIRNKECCELERELERSLPDGLLVCLFF
jgi:hypothetical protein